MSNLKDSSKKTNEELMLSFQKGDNQSFELLYGRYKNAIYSYTKGIAKQDELARELAQETFLKVYKNKDQYTKQFKFTTWLWTIARNTTIDHLKRKDASRYTSDLNFQDESNDPLENFESQLSGPEELTMQSAQNKMVRECLEELPANQKEATVLRMFSELSYDEIAQTLKGTVSAIKSLLNRAKKSLLRCVEGKIKGVNHE